jgi:hypothetical protein
MLNKYAFVGGSNFNIIKMHGTTIKKVVMSYLDQIYKHHGLIAAVGAHAF